MTIYSLVILLSQFWPSPLFHVCFLIVVSWPAYRFLRRQVRCLVLPSSQFVVIHILKGFSLVNEAEVDIFLELPCFLHEPRNVGNLISVPLSFWNPACTFQSSLFVYCWSLSWRILTIILLTCEMSAIVWQFEHQCPLFNIRYSATLGIQFLLYFSYSLDETLDLVFSNFCPVAMEDKGFLQNTHSNF